MLVNEMTEFLVETAMLHGEERNLVTMFNEAVGMLEDVVDEMFSEAENGEEKKGFFSKVLNSIGRVIDSIVTLLAKIIKGFFFILLKPFGITWKWTVSGKGAIKTGGDSGSSPSSSSSSSTKGLNMKTEGNTIKVSTDPNTAVDVVIPEKDFHVLNGLQLLKNYASDLPTESYLENMADNLKRNSTMYKMVKASLGNVSMDVSTPAELLSTAKILENTLSNMTKNIRGLYISGLDASKRPEAFKHDNVFSNVIAKLGDDNILNTNWFSPQSISTFGESFASNRIDGINKVKVFGVDSFDSSLFEDSYLAQSYGFVVGYLSAMQVYIKNVNNNKTGIAPYIANMAVSEPMVSKSGTTSKVLTGKMNELTEKHEHLFKEVLKIMTKEGQENGKYIGASLLNSLEAGAVPFPKITNTEKIVGIKITNKTYDVSKDMNILVGDLDKYGFKDLLECKTEVVKTQTKINDEYTKVFMDETSKKDKDYKDIMGETKNEKVNEMIKSDLANIKASVNFILSEYRSIVSLLSMCEQSSVSALTLSLLNMVDVYLSMGASLVLQARDMIPKYEGEAKETVSKAVDILNGICKTVKTNLSVSSDF
ncbi:MAG: hypothetical protein ACRC92_26065 [Peptostreptococcaceae bacterium]